MSRFQPRARSNLSARPLTAVDHRMPPSVPSTPFPLRSGHGKAASPSELLSQLESLVADNLGENDNEPIPVSAREGWLAIIEGLAEHFLESFPKPRSVLWNTLHEKVGLCTTSLTIIERAARRVEGLFSETDRRSLDILRRMFNLLLTLEAWSCSLPTVCNKVESPSSLRSKLIKTLAPVLRSFARSTLESSAVMHVLAKSLKAIHGATSFPVKW